MTGAGTLSRGDSTKAYRMKLTGKPKGLLRGLGEWLFAEAPFLYGSGMKRVGILYPAVLAGRELRKEFCSVRQDEQVDAQKHTRGTLNSNQEPGFLKSFFCNALQRWKRAACTQDYPAQLSPIFID